MEKSTPGTSSTQGPAWPWYSARAAKPGTSSTSSTMASSPFDFVFSRLGVMGVSVGIMTIWWWILKSERMGLEREMMRFKRERLVGSLRRLREERVAGDSGGDGG